MALKRIVKLDTGSLAAGSFTDLTYAAEVNLTIKKIIAVEATGASINNVVATFYIADVPYFMPDTSLMLFHPSNQYNPDIDLVLPAGVRLTMRVTNNEAAARRVLIHLICE
ncbi:MAG: hypothetical protein QXM71_07585 [Thermofilum sp.]